MTDMTELNGLDLDQMRRLVEQVQNDPFRDFI